MSWRQFDETEPEKRDLELVQGSHYFNHHIPLVLQHGPTLVFLFLRRGSGSVALFCKTQVWGFSPDFCENTILRHELSMMAFLAPKFFGGLNQNSG